MHFLLQCVSLNANVEIDKKKKKFTWNFVTAIILLYMHVFQRCAPPQKPIVKVYQCSHEIGLWRVFAIKRIYFRSYICKITRKYAKRGYRTIHLIVSINFYFGIFMIHAIVDNHRPFQGFFLSHNVNRTIDTCKIWILLTETINYSWRSVRFRGSDGMGLILNV